MFRLLQMPFERPALGGGEPIRTPARKTKPPHQILRGAAWFAEFASTLANGFALLAECREARE
jgi:hypothetical protein